MEKQTVANLRFVAKGRGIKYYYKIRKVDLIRALRAAGFGEPPEPTVQQNRDNKRRKALESIARKQGIQNYANMTSPEIIKAMHDKKQATTTTTITNTPCSKTKATKTSSFSTTTRISSTTTTTKN